MQTQNYCDQEIATSEQKAADEENKNEKVQKIIDNMVTKNDYEELSAVIETKQSILNAERY